MIQVDRMHIAHATDEDGDPWAVSDGLLYDLCKKYPDHRNPKAVTAKMLLIGRTYAATAERGRSAGAAAKSSNDDFYIRDLPESLRTSNLDDILAWLRQFPRISEQNMSEVIKAHTELMNVLYMLTGVGKRSLASKYLHFHRPDLFFILDSRAQNAIRLVSSKLQRNSMPMEFPGDSQYVLFVRSALLLRERLEGEFDVTLTPRHLDRILLAVDTAATKQKNSVSA
jgi:hypothetical protein